MLYEDRVYAYEKMVSIYPFLDSADDVIVSEYVDADTRNHLAFLELSQYNKDSTFIYLHPLLKSYKLEVELNQLRKINPEKFMNELVNANKNITRYQSQINSKKYKTIEEMNGWLAIIAEYTDKLSIMKRLISK